MSTKKHNYFKKRPATTAKTKHRPELTNNASQNNKSSSLTSRRREKKVTKKKALVLVAIVVASAIVLLPFYSGTGTYPFAVVNGNSMYPTLQNGDIVFFSAAKATLIPNGTIIVFVQSETSDSALNGLFRPVLVHRIIGMEIQKDGTILYQTKGDNNDANDPFLTSQRNVLGTESITVPKLGLIILFIQSPQGLIAVVGIITLTYLGFYDSKRREDKKKEKLLGVLASKVLNNEISEEQFRKIQLVLDHSENFEKDGFKDESVNALTNWLKKDGLEKWTLETTECTACSGKAFLLKGEDDNSIIICSNCSEIRNADKTPSVLILPSFFYEVKARNNPQT